MKQSVLAALLALTVCATTLDAQTPFTVTGVTDKAIVSAPVTLNMPTEAGYTYALYLNATNVSSGGSYIVRDPDFYLLQAFRTNTTTLAVTNRFFRFIIRNPARGNTEDGLPTHTPLLAIPSATNEFAGGRLRLITPINFPAGYERPVVAWAVDDTGKALRANGRIQFSLPSETPNASIFIRRGSGSGFLPTNMPSALHYATLANIVTNKALIVESDTIWTPVSGTLSGDTVWSANARIHVQGSITIPLGSSLTVGAGAVVRLNSRVDITNNGLVAINGTIDTPVVFMPNSRTQPWGGFIMRAGTGEINATGTIFTGSGAEPKWFDANGNPGSHRDEQALVSVHQNQSVTMTDCATIFLAGQLGHSANGGTFTFERLLMQGGTSAGEYHNATFRVNDSAFIEFPNDSSNFVDGDNDALYLVDGTFAFTNTLFGWTKDDGIDSGGDGYATIYYESCWFESTFHEGNSLSGFKNVFPRNTVYMDCSQGHEVGYGAPTGRVDRCLFIGNKSGARLGDNYDWDYNGRLFMTNAIALYNHRDVFGYNWDVNGWTNAWGQMEVRGNWLTKPDTNFPENAIWDPAADGWRLASFATGPINIVGVGMALRSGQITAADLTNGIPVRLSTFCTNFVSVDYAIETASSVIASGTLQFVPGEIVKWVRISPAQVPAALVRVQLRNAVNGEITQYGTAFLGGGTSGAVPVIAQGAEWKYPNAAGALADTWKTAEFDDSSWLSGPTELGFGDGDEARTITLFANQITYYFRKTFTVDDPDAFTSLAMWLRRDDGAVVYLNGSEVFRSSSLPAPPAVITATTRTATGQTDNVVETATLSAAALVPGVNLAAVEMHQQEPTSSDLSFDFRLEGNLAPRLELVRFGDDWLLMWADVTFALEEASEITGPWTRTNANSPVPVARDHGARFYRLAK